MSTSDEQLHAQWVANVLQIGRELSYMLAHRTMWVATSQAIQDHAPKLHSVIWPSHYTGMYVTTQTISLRRIVRGDSDRDQVSLCGLLLSIEQHPEVLGPERFQSMARAIAPSERYVSLALGHYLEDWCSTEGAFDPQYPRRDRNELMRALSQLLTWSDRTIAHMYPKEGPPSTPPITFGELDSAINAATAMYVKYRILLEGTHDATDHLLVDPSWVTVFANPLFPAISPTNWPVETPDQV